MTITQLARFSQQKDYAKTMESMPEFPNGSLPPPDMSIPTVWKAWDSQVGQIIGISFPWMMASSIRSRAICITI